MRRATLIWVLFFLVNAVDSGVLAQHASVKVTDAWARATPGGAQTGAVYMTVETAGDDRLVAVSTPAAKEAQLHQMTMDNGVMKMRQVEGVDLPAGKAVTLKPGGYHIMLLGLVEPLREGQTFPLTLGFAKAGPQSITAAVRNLGATSPAPSMPGMHH
jgi:copper(I)-binding protein